MGLAPPLALTQSECYFFNATSVPNADIFCTPSAMPIRAVASTEAARQRNGAERKKGRGSIPLSGVDSPP